MPWYNGQSDMLFLQENNIHRRRNLVMHIDIFFAKILLLHRFENFDCLKWKKMKNIDLYGVEMAIFFTKNYTCLDYVDGMYLATLWLG